MGEVHDMLLHTSGDTWEYGYTHLRIRIHECLSGRSLLVWRRVAEAMRRRRWLLHACEGGERASECRVQMIRDTVRCCGLAAQHAAIVRYGATVAFNVAVLTGT